MSLYARSRLPTCSRCITLTLTLTLTKAANLIALQSKYGVSNERISEYKTIFSFFDADGGGSIDRDEFRFAMRCIDEEMSEVHSL